MPLWISSFPRSGNTLVRQMIYSGWGQLSGSISKNDLGDNLDLIRSCGHVELKKIKQSENRLTIINPNNVPIKTHAPLPGKGQIIYVMRAGRKSIVSLWEFMGRATDIQAVIRGQTPFGLWSDHVMQYMTSDRIVAALRYEDILADSSAAIKDLSALFGAPVDDPAAPLSGRNDLAQSDGKWVRKLSDWREHWSHELDELFRETNAPAIERFYPQEAHAFDDAD